MNMRLTRDGKGHMSFSQTHNVVAPSYKYWFKISRLTSSLYLP